MADNTPMSPTPGDMTQRPDWLVAVINEPTEAERAVQALYQAGFAQDDVTLSHGPDAVDQMQERGQQKSLLGKLADGITKAVSDSGTYEEDYADEAHAGHSTVHVHTSDPEEVEKARQILVAHNAHHIRHMGRWNTTTLDDSAARGDSIG